MKNLVVRVFDCRVTILCAHVFVLLLLIGMATFHFAIKVLCDVIAHFIFGIRFCDDCSMCGRIVRWFHCVLYDCAMLFTVCDKASMIARSRKLFFQFAPTETICNQQLLWNGHVRNFFRTVEHLLYVL